MSSFIVFHEFPPQSNDSMQAEVLQELGRSHLSTGFLKVYQPGFLRIARLLNWSFVYFVTPYRVWRFRNSLAVITVTVPPLIQIWLSLWCYLFRSRLVVWMMDYHPEIEARILDNFLGFRWLASVLRWVDRLSLRKVHLVIALDHAIAAAVKRQSPSTPVIIHPTWNSQPTEPNPPLIQPNPSNDINLLYLGNFGLAHELDTLRRFLGLARNKGLRVNLLVVGCSEGGNRKFAEMAAQLNLQMIIEPRLATPELLAKCREHQVSAGLVLLKTSAGGTVSPSKFSTYLHMGLPLLYSGPPDTNADLACVQFGAGMAIRAEWSEEVLKESVADFIHSDEQAKRWNSVHTANQYFSQFNGRTLAAAINAELNQTSPLSINYGNGKNPNCGSEVPLSKTFH